jgi:hypothetical protein
MINLIDCCNKHRCLDALFFVSFLFFIFGCASAFFIMKFISQNIILFDNNTIDFDRLLCKRQLRLFDF